MFLGRKLKISTLANQKPDDMIIPGRQKDGTFSWLTERGSEIHMKQWLNRRSVDKKGRKNLRTRRINGLLLINLYERFYHPGWDRLEYRK